MNDNAAKNDVTIEVTLSPRSVVIAEMMTVTKNSSSQTPALVI